MKVTCANIKRDAGRRIHRMVSETIRDGNERGASIFVNKDKLRFSDTVIGNSKGIDLRVKNPIRKVLTGQRVIATIHTHPDVEFDNEISILDMQMLFDNNLSFIIVAFADGGKSMFSVYEKEYKNQTFDDFSGNLSENDKIDLIKQANERLRSCTIELWHLN